MKDEGEKKQETPVDSYLVADTQAPYVEATLSYSAPTPSCTSSCVPMNTHKSSTSPLPPRVVLLLLLPPSPLTQIALLKMGQLSFFADCHDSRHEATYLG